VSFTIQPLYPRGKISRHPLELTLVGLQGRSGHCDDEEKEPAPVGNRTPAV